MVKCPSFSIETVPAVSEIWFCLALFDTTSRAVGGRTEPRLAPRSGNLTPPRISPSCPHCLWLWLGRGTIVGGQGHCKTACQGCFCLDGDRWAPSLAVFDADSYPHRWSWRIRLIAFPFSKACPLMLFSRRIFCFQAARGRAMRTPSLSLPLSEGVERKIF